MRTARLLTVSCSPGGGSASSGADPPGCRPPGHVTCDAYWEATPPPFEQNDTQV